MIANVANNPALRNRINVREQFERAGGALPSSQEIVATSASSNLNWYNNLMPRARYTEEQRRAAFWEKVRRGPGCYEWTGAKCWPYGKFDWYDQNGKKEQVAHRYAWFIEHGPIPEGLQVCHHCDNGICVRDSHLFLGTASDNAQDCLSKGRRPTGPMYAQCKYGHELSGENVYVTKPGTRICLTCKRRRGREEARRRLGIPPERWRSRE